MNPRKFITVFFVLLAVSGVGQQTCPDAPTVTDADGNVYQTVQLGSQCWMAENLRTGARVNGTDTVMK